MPGPNSTIAGQTNDESVAVGEFLFLRTVRESGDERAIYLIRAGERPLCIDPEI